MGLIQDIVFLTGEKGEIMKLIKDRLDTAIHEANRFLARADKWRACMEADKLAYLSGSAEGGACKRASLDLTRALAELRKGNG